MPLEPICHLTVKLCWYERYAERSARLAWLQHEVKARSRRSEKSMNFPKIAAPLTLLCVLGVSPAFAVCNISDAKLKEAVLKSRSYAIPRTATLSAIYGRCAMLRSFCGPMACTTIVSECLPTSVS